MQFCDQTEIEVRAGKGGNGLVSFKSAANAPKLGPDGGDGGHGGSVYLVGDRGINTLSCVRYKHIYKAEPGVKGGSNGKTGRRGKDCIITVPLGTIIRSQEGSIGEITEEGEHLLVARGGRRGVGNMKFLKPTHQAPEEYTKGTAGEELFLELELQVIADIGLAGFPNAGKSSLLAALSSAKPKVADYPFTTLIPNIGVVDLSDKHFKDIRSFVMADIPGLIEGASEGRGLGFQFLRHLKRTKLIAITVDASEEEAPEKFEAIKNELEKYGLTDKKLCVILTKKDIVSDEVNIDFLRGIPYVFVSSATRENFAELKEFLYHLQAAENQEDNLEVKTFAAREEFEIVRG